MFDFLKNLFSTTPTTPLADDEPTSAQAKDADPTGLMSAFSGVPLQTACDQVRGAYGEFGFDLTNPIPVNGVRGAIVYLSRLFVQRGSTACPFFFHRLASLDSPVVKGRVDKYELVSNDASTWLTLYLHQYHPRRSRRAPAGLLLLPWSRMDDLRRSLAKLGVSGDHMLVGDFPFGLVGCIAANKKLTSVSPEFPTAMAKEIRQQLLKHRGQWGRPEPHWFSEGLEPPPPPSIITF